MLTPAADRGTLISVRPPEPRSVPPAGVAHIPPGHGDGPFAPLAPYTFVIDGRIVARVRTQADTLELRQLRSLDPKDIESIEVVRDSIARVRYPESVGNAIVIRLTQKHGTSPRR